MDVTGINAYETPLPAQPTQAPTPRPVAEMPVNQGANAKNTATTATTNQQRVANEKDAVEKDKQSNSSVTKDTVEKTIEQINKSILTYNREMHVSVHQKTQRIMVKVMDTTENKVIREIPPERVLDAFAKTLELAGILVDKKS